MNKPKLHHHLPQSYQLGFSEQSRIWVFDRSTGKVRKDTPRNVAAITNDYTIHRQDGTKDTRVEELLAVADSTAISIIKKLRDRESLSDDERESFSWYLAAFVARVPRFRRWVNERETAKRKVFDRQHLKSPDQIRQLLAISDLSPAQRADTDPQLIYEMLKSEDYSVSLDHNSQVKALVDSTIEIQPRLHDLNWVVAHATADSPFVTSDNPVVEAASGAFVTFPIASDLALLMVPTSADKLMMAHRDMPAEMVHATNVEVAKASERLVLASNEQLLLRVVADSGVAGAAPPPLFDIGPRSG